MSKIQPSLRDLGDSDLSMTRNDGISKSDLPVMKKHSEITETAFN